MTDETILKNQPDRKWEMMLPDLGRDSPIFTLLRVDTTLMIDFPTALHIPKHTHEKSETHFILRGSHLLENSDSGERFDVQQGGYFYLPGHIVHEAWVPANAQAIIILEDGWKVNWLDGAPTSRDIGYGTPECSTFDHRSDCHCRPRPRSNAPRFTRRTRGGDRQRTGMSALRTASVT